MINDPFAGTTIENQTSLLIKFAQFGIETPEVVVAPLLSKSE
jgi:hypothetical protein